MEKILEFVGFTDLNKKIWEKAEEIFGSQEKAAKWIKSENPVLGTTPVKAMANRFGAEEVMNILGKIEYGVYS